MRKNIFGRRFKRDINERKALFKSLMSALVLDEKIKTTEAKAKSIKGSIEKLVTVAKKKEDNARKFLSGHLIPEAIDKMINRIAPQFTKRPGGYTRIVRMRRRVSDSASMVVMEWTEEIIKKSESPVTNVKKKDNNKKSQSKKIVTGKKKSKLAKKSASVKKENKPKTKTKKK